MSFTSSFTSVSSTKRLFAIFAKVSFNELPSLSKTIEKRVFIGLIKLITSLEVLILILLKIFLRMLFFFLQVLLQFSYSAFQVHVGVAHRKDLLQNVMVLVLVFHKRDLQD